MVHYYDWDKHWREICEKKAKGVLGWYADFFPNVRMSKLFDIMQFGRRFLDIERGVFENLVNEGVLSVSEQGNYSVRSVLLSDFNVNPLLRPENPDEQPETLYFTSKDVAEGFRNGFVRKTSRISGEALETVCSGSFQIPVDITVQDWKVLRIKNLESNRSYSSTPSDVLSALRTREILTGSGKGNWSVVYQPSPKRTRRFLNFESREVRYYFKDKGDANKYARSFPKGLSADVIWQE